MASRRPGPRAAALASGLFASALPSLAWANSATGLAVVAVIFAPVCWAIGACAIVVSALLGAAAWWSALRAKLDSPGKVFARGFLGVGAGVSFGVGAVAVACGFLVMVGNGKVWDTAAVVTSLLAIVLTIAFLTVEFVIAGLLYLRVHRRQGEAWALPLAAVSFGIAGLLALSPCAGLLLFVVAALS
jgi:hypothetical protein